MKNYNEYIKESLELSGKNSFFNLLQIIGNHNYHFIYSKYYTDAYQYLYFFVTETIKDVEDFLDVFQYKTSLKSSNYVLDKLKNNKVTFFFGINKDNILRYGILDSVSKKSHVVGEFKVNDKYFDTIKKYKAIAYINKYLKTINTKNITLMRQIQKEMVNFYKSKHIKKVDIEGKNSIITKVDIQKFSDDDIKTNRPFRVLHEWVSRKKWKSKVHYYVNETDTELEFIIIVN
jgi:hypothetical protein